jgi:DNA polymerase-3 subunit epsilon
MAAAPARTGRRRGWRAGSYAALDFETTGLDLQRDAIVSYGVVPVDGGRARIAGSIHQLVRPSVPPSPRSQTVHLLRPLDLEDAPSVEVASADLRARLAGRFLLAWFADVEVHLLARMLGGSVRRWRRRTIDVRNLAIAIDGEPASVRARHGYPLSGTARRYGVPVATPHEAYDDALVTAQLFLVLVGKLPSLPEPSIADLLRVARP